MPLAREMCRDPASRSQLVGGLELVIFALVVLFYIITWLYRMVQRLATAARRLLTPGLTPPTTGAQGRRLEQTEASKPSQQVGPRATANKPPEGRARRPEAGGPAVPNTATSEQFRAQVALIETQELSGAAASAVTHEGSETQTAPLFGNRDDIVRAVILQEVLARPLSLRHRSRSHDPSTNSPH